MPETARRGRCVVRISAQGEEGTGSELTTVCAAKYQFFKIDPYDATFRTFLPLKQGIYFFKFPKSQPKIS